MGDTGSVYIKERDLNKHRNFEKKLFERTDGNWQIKALLSSYSFMNNGAQGIPDGKSDCANCVGDQCKSCSRSMAYQKAFDPNSCGYDSGDSGNWKEGVYTRVHRDQ
jgi:alpha-amylase